MKRLSVMFAGALAAGAGLAQAEDAPLAEKCAQSYGSIAVSESQGASSSQLSSYGLGSPVALLRIMIQQSGCFSVVERGAALQDLQQERAMAAAGEMQAGSNLGKGQMQAADFVMTPNVQFAASDTGGAGGALAGLGRGLFGGLGNALGAVTANLKFKEARTSLLIADVRSGIQVASAEGVAKKTDFSLGGAGLAGAGLAIAGGYINTPEGKMVAASLQDNFNKIILTIRDQPSLVKNRAPGSSTNAAMANQAGAPVGAGQGLVARLNNVKVFKEASGSSQQLGTLKKGEEVIASGEEREGFLKIDSEHFSGAWVQKTLLGPAGH